MPESDSIQIAPVAMLNGRASFAYLNGVAIVLSDIDKWTDEMVMELIEEQATLAGSVSATANITHFFGEVFSARHRKLITEWIESKGLTASPRTAMVTESTIMRSALTAYSWLTKTEVKAFPPNKLDQLCEWITEDAPISAEEAKTALLRCYQLIGKNIN